MGGYPLGTSMSWALSNPTSRNSRSVSSAIFSTGSDGYPGKATEAIPTSRSSSSMTVGMTAAALSATCCACICCVCICCSIFSPGSRSWFGPQTRSAPMSAPTAMVVAERTSMGMKKLWSNSLVPSLVVPERSKFAAAICVPFAGRV